MNGKRERPEGDDDLGGDQSRRKASGQDDDEDQDSEDRDTDEEAEGEDSDEEDSDSADEFTLDELGRVPGGILPHAPCYPDLDYGFRCFPSFLDVTPPDLERLVADCRSTFSARTTRKGQKYSAGETYWLAAAHEPRCALEKLAKDVFDFHTKGKEAGVDYDPNTSGAEWWTLVLNADDDVGLHWDRDYSLEEESILVHPHLSTVTYLSNVGGPTVVLGCISPMESDALDEIVGPIDEAFVSRPAVGKHISFDGRLLHGAPADANVWKASTVSVGNASRVTFLVNVWLNHVPSSSESLPAERVAQLCTPELILRNGGGEPVEKEATTLDVTEEESTKVIEMRFVAGSSATLRMPLPVKDLGGGGGGGGSACISTDGGSWLLKFEEAGGPGNPEGKCRIYRN